MTELDKFHSGIVPETVPLRKRKLLCALFCMCLGWYPGRKVLQAKFRLTYAQVGEVITSLRGHGLKPNKKWDEEFLNDLCN